MSHDIKLTWDETYAAVAVGGHRRVASERGRTKAQHYESPDNSQFSTEIEAVCAELIVARFLDLFPRGLIFGRGVAETDVGPFQVRHTGYSNGHLVIYREDRDDDPFVLVVGRWPMYRIAGWMWGRDAKSPGFWTTAFKGKPVRTPAWYVPQSALRELKKSDLATIKRWYGEAA